MLCMGDVKAKQMTVQRILIWGLMLCKFELGHKIMEATKNICCVKG